MRNFKKMISIVLSFSLLTAALPINVFAEYFNKEEVIDYTKIPYDEEKKQNELKKIENGKPCTEYDFQAVLSENNEFSLYNGENSTVSTTAGIVYRGDKEAVIIFSVPDDITSVSDVVVSGGTATYTCIQNGTFQVYLRDLQPQSEYSVTPVFENGNGNTFVFNTRTYTEGIYASWNGQNNNLALYGKGGEKTTYNNQGWHFSKSDDNLTYNVIPYNTSENISEIAIIVRNNSDAANEASRFGFWTDVQIKSNDYAPIYNKNAGFLMTDGTYTLMLANKGSSILNGKKYVYNQYGKSYVQAETTKWWGYYGDASGNVYNDLEGHGDLTNIDSGAAVSWQNIVLDPGETRIYTAKFATGVSDEEDIIDWIDDVNNLTLTVEDENGNDVSNSCTVNWYEEGNENIISVGNILTSASPEKKYYYEIILGDTLGVLYSEPERQPVDVNIDTYDVSYTLNPLNHITVTGTIKDNDGNPLNGATVQTVQTANMKYTKNTEVTTDENGIFNTEILVSDTEVNVSATGYYDRRFTIKAEELTDMANVYNMGSKGLRKMPENKITLSMLKKSAVSDGEQSITTTVTSFSGLQIELFDKTQNRAVTDFVTQYPNIVIGDESVNGGDEISVKIIDSTHGMTDYTSIAVLSETKTASLSVEFTENGKMVCNSVVGNPSNIAMIFDDNGNFVERHILNTISLETNNLISGNYTAVFVKKTALLQNISNVSKLTEFGLAENVDYAKINFTINNGVVLQLEQVSVPVLDESKLYYTADDSTSFMASTDETVVGKMIVLRAEYEILPEYSASEQKVKIEIPDDLSFVDNSLTLNGSVNSYIKNDNEITVLTNSMRGVVRFYAMASKPKAYEVNAYLSFKLNNDSILQPIGTARFITTAAKLSVPNKTGRKNITVTGATSINSEVTVYDNFQEVGKTNSNSNGTWSLQYTLNDQYDYGIHGIYAEIKTKYGVSVSTEMSTFIYDKSYIEVSKITMINTGDNGQNTSVFDSSNPENVPSYRMWPGRYTLFTFIVEFTGGTSETISDVSAVTTNTVGENTYIPCTYDEVTGKWIGTHHFYTFADAPVKVSAVFTDLSDTSDDKFDSKKYNDMSDDINNMYADIESKNSKIDELSENVNNEFASENPDYDAVINNIKGINEASGIEADCSNIEGLENQLNSMSDDSFDNNMEEFFNNLDVENKDDNDDGDYIVEKYTSQEAVEGLDGKKYNLVSKTCDGINESELIADGFQTVEGTDGIRIYQKLDGEVLKIADFNNNLYSETSLSNMSELLGMDLVSLFASSDNDVAQWLSVVSSIQNLAETAKEWVSELANGFAADLARSQTLAEQAAREASEAASRLRWYESRWANATYGKINSPTHIEYKRIAAETAKKAEKASKNYSILKKAGIASKCLTVLSYLILVIDLANDIIELVNIYKSIPNPCPDDEELADSIRTRIWLLGGQLVAYAGANAIIIAAFNPATLLISLVGILAQIVVGEAYSRMFSSQLSYIKKDKSRLKCSDDPPEDPEGGGRLKPILDPSGFIYEAVPSNRIEGVKAEAYFYDYPIDEFGMPAETKSEILWDASEYDQVNPLYTDLNGMYAWDVPVGQWLVKFSKDGYYNTDSKNDSAVDSDGYLPVPPPQTDVNTAIISKSSPVVENVNVYNNEIQLIFNQYMNIDSVNASNITVNCNGQNITGTITPTNAEYNLKQTKQFASIFKFVPNIELTDTVHIEIKNVKNYNDMPMVLIYSKTHDVILQPESIDVSDNIGVTYNSGALLEIQVLPAEAGANKNITVSSSSPGIVGIVNNTLTTNELGKANVMLSGILPGEAEITVSLDGTDIGSTSKAIVGNVAPTDNKCKKVTADIENNSTVEKGTRITLSTQTEGAEIYYTLDGTCPCTVDSPSRIKYIAPIEINEYTFLIAYAVKDGMVDSSTAGFVYNVPVGKAAKPIASTLGSAVNSGTQITLTTTTDGAKIYYTVDGSIPTSTSNEYSAPITITGAVTIKAIAIKDGMSSSDVMSESYTIKPSVTPPGGGGGGGGGGAAAPASSYAVTFETNGGSSIDTQQVEKNKTATSPVSPSKENYVFNGWFTDKELKSEYNFSTAVTKSFTLYAKWSPVDETQKWGNPFNDVKTDDWYYDSVKYVNENKLMNGITSDSFVPNENLTRAMFITVLHRIENEPDVTGNTFSDVPQESYFEKAVAWGFKNGIISGTSEKEFSPDSSITREQMATIMYRYAKYKNFDVSVGENTNINSYSDFNNISEYAYSALQWTVGSKIMLGKTNDTLNPKDTATRAEAATVFMRMVDVMK